MTCVNLDSFLNRRDRLNIVAEIINIARKGSPKTRIMYKANMSFAAVNDYLPFLLKTSLITQASDGKKTIYKSTEKGMTLLNLYSQLTELISENDHFEGNLRTPPMMLLTK